MFTIEIEDWSETKRRKSLVYLFINLTHAAEECLKNETISTAIKWKNQIYISLFTLYNDV